MDRQTRELKRKAQELFRAIDATADRASLVAISERVEEMQPELDAQLDGLGFNLFIWIGLKMDDDQNDDTMSEDFKTRIVERYEHLRMR